MRYAILSDVHANLEALQAVVQHVQGQGVEQCAFLGDAVGYGANPNEVCDILRALCPIAVLGNHDAGVLGKLAAESFYDAARAALLWTRRQLSRTNREWLEGLPLKQHAGQVDFCHGAPWRPEFFEYLFGVGPLRRRRAQLGELAPLTLIGHSHLTLMFEFNDAQITPLLAPQHHLQADFKYIATVGSVGQPRDHDPRACYCVLDTETQMLEYHRVAYDVQQARQKIIAAHLAPAFGDRLLVGV